MTGTDEDFDAVDWADVYQRQRARGDLSSTITSLLHLASGDTVIDIGCGPGYSTQTLAKEIAPGTVIAIDRHREAVSFLRDLPDISTETLAPIVGDVTALPLRPTQPVPAVLAFVLHHLERPAGALREIADTLPGNSSLLVLEYTPEGAGEVGPSLAGRIAPETACRWLREADFVVERRIDRPDEQYAIVARRR